jgi:phage host-nuclease inhibitor protein Gam
MKKLKDRNDAEAAMNALAQVANNRRKLIAQSDAAKLAIDAKYADGIALCDGAISEAEAALATWAEANPGEFGKKKSIKFPSGTIGWREGQPKLERTSKAISWERCLEAVQNLLPNFIRQKPEIDKEAIIAQRADLAPILPHCGLKVVQGEQFYAKPNLTETDVQS